MLKLHCEKIGQGNEKSLIIVHGFMGCSEEYIKMAQELSESFDCYLIDLPGHAQSKKLLEEFPTIESIAHEISSWAKTLPSPHFYGYSMGGRIGIALSSIKYSPFVKIIIESANPGIQSTDERTKRALHDEDLFKDVTDEQSFKGFLRTWYQQELFQNIEEMPNFNMMLERKIKNNDPQSLQQAIKQYSVGKQKNYWQSMANPVCSSLYIYGEGDKKYREIALKISTLGWTTAKINNCGHITHFCNYEKFIENFKKFMIG